MAEDPRRVATGIDLKNRMELEEPGKIHIFDVTTEFVQETSRKCSLGALVGDVKGKTEEEKQEIFAKYGRILANTVIEQADTRYSDRTGKLVHRVAEQTGIWFPDTFRRYLEIILLVSRPDSRWTVELATRGEYRIKIRNCPIQNALKAAGENTGKLLCRNIDFASTEVICDRLRKRVNSSMVKGLAGSGLQECEFSFTPTPDQPEH